MRNSADLEIEVFGIKDKLAIGKWDGVLSIGEHCDLKVILIDYWDYLSDKIEDIGIESSGDSEDFDTENSVDSCDKDWMKVLGLEVAISCYASN